MSGQTENTVPKQLTPWKPGQSGNPSGRPKGSRNKLTEQFLADVHDKWQEHGVKCIDEMIADKPGDFVKLVATIIPKEATLNINDHSELTDDEIAERVRNLAAQLAPFLTGGAGDIAEGTAGEGSAQVTSRVH